MDRGVHVHRVPHETAVADNGVAPRTVCTASVREAQTYLDHQDRPGAARRAARQFEIPQLGFGVFQVPPEPAEVVTRALLAGYRHIDTAAAYRNEAGVGQALARCRPRARRGLHHDEAASTTTTAPRRPSVLRHSLEQLELEHVDLYLIHWPVPGARTATSRPGRRSIELQAEGLRARSASRTSSPAPAADRSTRPASPRRQPGRAAPAPPAARAAARARRPRHRHRGVEPAGPGRRCSTTRAITAIAAGARQDARPGRPALAPAARQRRDPEVGDAERIAENLDVFDFHLTDDEIAAIEALREAGAAAADTLDKAVAGPRWRAVWDRSGRDDGRRAPGRRASPLPGAREERPFLPRARPDDLIKVERQGLRASAASAGSGPLRGEPQVRARGRGRAAGRGTRRSLPGYHLNKRHWNTVIIDGSLPDR